MNSGKMCLEYCSTDNMIADLMTKPTSRLKLQKSTQFLFGSLSACNVPMYFCCCCCLVKY